MTAMKLPIIDVEQRYTAKEFEAMTEFDDFYELLEGKIIKKSMPGDEHGTIISKLIIGLVLLDPAQKLGKWWTNTSFEIGVDWEPLPDLGFVVAKRVASVIKGAVRVIPDLVVEVHSPRDLLAKNKIREETATKIRKYQEVGVRIVWAINPKTHQVEVYHPEQTRPNQKLSANDELDGENVIPGFRFKVASLFD